MLLVQGYGLVLQRGGRRWGAKGAAGPGYYPWTGWTRLWPQSSWNPVLCPAALLPPSGRLAQGLPALCTSLWGRLDLFLLR